MIAKFLNVVATFGIGGSLVTTVINPRAEEALLPAALLLIIGALAFMVRARMSRQEADV